jgi:hypothetical protein
MRRRPAPLVALVAYKVAPASIAATESLDPIGSA